MGARASLPGNWMRATIAVGGDWVAISGNHDGGLGPGAAGQRQRHQAHIGRHGLEVVAGSCLVQVRRLQDLGGFGPRLLAASWVMLMTLNWLSAPPSPIPSYRLCSVMAKAAPSRKVRTALWPWAPRCSRSCASHPGAGTRIGGLRAGMQGIGHAAIGKLALTMAQVAFQRGHIALWGQGGGIGGHAAGLALVPRGQGHGIGAHLLAHAPCGDLVFTMAAGATQIGATKSQGAHVGTAASSSKMTRCAGWRRAPAPAPALLGHQALHEGPVGSRGIGWCGRAPGMQPTRQNGSVLCG